MTLQLKVIINFIVLKICRHKYISANYFRLQKLINCFLKPEYKRIIEIGLGEFTPALTLSKAGKNVFGFDISTKMVKEAQKRLDKAGVPKNNVICADINDPISYIQLLNDGPLMG